MNLSKRIPLLAAPLLLAMSGAVMSATSAADVPATVAVPAGSNPAMTLKGVGLLSYECRAKPGSTDAFEWVFTGPDAQLQDMSGKQVGKYYGGPTWEHMDGSKVTGKQLAIAPAAAGNIPMQLVQTSPAMGSGAFTGVTYIQRVNTMGGVAPAMPCDASKVSTKSTVKYSADYVFYK
jgi:hypothetical protein